MKYGLFIFVFFLHLSLCSQEYVLLGSVKDGETGEPLIGATVTACSAATVTDVEGAFQLDIEESSCPVSISYLGYEMFADTINLPLEDGKPFIAFLTKSDNILDQAVITASKYALRQSETTVSLQVLKAQSIESSNVSSIDDVIENLPGVDVLDGQVNIRGGSGYAYGVGSRVMLMLDGIPSLQYDGGNAHWDDIPQENIQQVEVLKGASSVLYGSSALNGVIQFRTQEATLKPRLTAAMSYRYYMNPEDIRRKWWDDTRYEVFANASYAQKIKDVDLVTGLNFNSLQSYNESTTRDAGRAFLKLKWRLSPKNSMHVNVLYNGNENSNFFYWNNPLRGAYQPADGTINTGTVHRFMVDPGWTHFDSYGDKHSLKTRFFYSNSESNNNQSIVSLSEYLNYDYTKALWNGKATWVNGFQGIYNFTNSDLYGNSMFTAYNAALFSQWTHKIVHNLSYTVGLRYELNALNNETFTYTLQGEERTVEAKNTLEGKPVFRAGINYSPFKGTHIRSSIGQGYRFPTIGEKFTVTQAGGIVVLPNPDLESETGYSAELGVRQEFQNFFVSSFLDIAGFYSAYNNMIEFQLNDDATGFLAENIGNTEIPGLEITWGTQWNVGKLKIQGLLGYTHINPMYRNFTEEIKNSGTSEDNILKYRYRNSFKSGFTLKLYQFEVWFNQRYNSHMVSIDRSFSTFINGIAAFRELNNKGFNVLDARLAYSYKKYSIGINLNNILNTTYTERPALLEAPRNISMRIGYRL